MKYGQGTHRAPVRRSHHEISVPSRSRGGLLPQSLVLDESKIDDPDASSHHSKSSASDGRGVYSRAKELAQLQPEIHAL